MSPDVGKVAALIGHPVRSRMLFSLLDGRELSASELAARGEASVTAASAHLAKLVEGGLLCARHQGRQRLFRLASANIAQAIEMLAAIAPVPAVRSLNQHTAMQRLRAARTCYDHLAGRLGVDVADALKRMDVISIRGDEFRITAPGERFFRELGVDLDDVRSQHRSLSRACMDWTERRYHVAGALGAALLTSFLDRRWVLRSPHDRSLRISDDGRASIESYFGFDPLIVVNASKDESKT